MPPTDDDGALVLAARGGDGEAFGLLFQRWSDRCFDVARRIVHDDGRAAEVTQDTFLVAWQQLDSLRDPAAFGGWVLRTSRNRALNRLEREGRSASYADDAPVFSLLAGEDDPAAQAVDDVSAVDHRELVEAATAVLGEREASVLDLHLRHGMSVPEIAEELGVTTNNAHQLLFRTKKRLTAGIRAWVLVRGGRPTCPVLGAELGDAGIDRFGRPALAVIDDHVGRCEECEARQAAAIDPAALFAGAPVLLLDEHLRAGIVDGLRAGGVPIPDTGAVGGGEGGRGGEGGGSGGGGGGGADAGGAGEATDPVPLPTAPGGPAASGSTAGADRRRRVLVAIAAGLMLLVGAVALLAPDPADEVAAGPAPGSTTTDPIDDEDDGAAATTDAGATTTSVAALPAPTPTTTAAPTTTAPEGAPTTTAPASDQGTVPGGPVAPNPTVAPTAPTTTRPPTTTTTRPAAPTVTDFRATLAGSPGGACPAGQWGTSLAWSTTGATAVRIAATTVATASGLPPNGSRVVCRPTPGAPPGGWTLTATGPGGSATASA
jgi:RNA polymerase sigma factor (sigma-70 family)